MNKFILTVITIFLLMTVSFAEDTCPSYGTHKYNNFGCSLIEVCDCGAIRGEHNFVDGKCSECGTLESEEVNDEGTCPECGNKMTEYSEDNIIGYRCQGCDYWSIGTFTGICPKGHGSLTWKSINNVGAYICTECNDIVGSVAACRNCGAISVPEIIKGYVVFSCCGYVDSNISIESLGIQQCSAESRVDGHVWKHKLSSNGGISTYYIVCLDCSRIVDTFSSMTSVSSQTGEISKIALSNNELNNFMYCTCEGKEKIGDEGWNYAGWNVTDIVHYTICDTCGAVKRSFPHDFTADGTCNGCGIKKNNNLQQERMCVCTDGGTKLNPTTWNYAGWNVTSIEHYLLCSKCNRLFSVGQHDFVNGSCNTCGFKSSEIETLNHVCEYINGFCTICKNKCKHSNSEWVCPVCGMENKTAIDELVNSLSLLYEDFDRNDTNFKKVIYGEIALSDYYLLLRTYNTGEIVVTNPEKKYYSGEEVSSYLSDYERLVINGIENSAYGGISITADEIRYLAGIVQKEVGNVGRTNVNGYVMGNKNETIAIVNVVLNRVLAGNYGGDSVYDVLTSPNQFLTKSQSETQYQAVENLEYYAEQDIAINVEAAIADVLLNGTNIVENATFYGGYSDACIGNGVVERIENSAGYIQVDTTYFDSRGHFAFSSTYN